MQIEFSQLASWAAKQDWILVKSEENEVEYSATNKVVVGYFTFVLVNGKILVVRTEKIANIRMVSDIRASERI